MNARHGADEARLKGCAPRESNRRHPGGGEAGAAAADRGCPGFGGAEGVDRDRSDTVRYCEGGRFLVL